MGFLWVILLAALTGFGGTAGGGISGIFSSLLNLIKPATGA